MPMASSPSSIALTVVFAFNAVLYCIVQLLGGGGAGDTMTTTQASQSGGLAPRLAAAALVPAALTTLTLTQLLVFAHLHARELVRATAGNGGGGARATEAVSRLVAGLAKLAVLAATLALLAAAVVQLGADGHLDRGRGDVARLNIK